MDSLRLVNRLWVGLCLAALLVMEVLAPLVVKADVLGDYSNISIHPGYMSWSQSSKVYKPLINLGRAYRATESRSPSQILQSYLTKDYSFDELKARAFIDEVNRYTRNAFLAFCSVKLPKEMGESYLVCKNLDPQTVRPKSKAESKFYKKWAEYNSNLASKLAVNSMEKAIHLARSKNFRNIERPEHHDFVEAFFTAIETFEALKGEDPQWGHISSMTKFYFSVVSNYFSFEDLKASVPEAANLPIPPAYQGKFPNQEFFSPEQLKHLEEKERVNIADFDPNPSGLWRNPTIHPKDWAPKDYSRQSLASLQSTLTADEIEDLLDNDKEISVVYEPVEGSRGESPKLKVTYGAQGQAWKLKFMTDKGRNLPAMSPAQVVWRVISSGEVNIEPAVNNIAAMVGFSVDPTYYKKVVRMYFHPDVYAKNDFDRYLEEELFFKLPKQFKSHWNVRSGFTSIKTDESGKKYIEFRGVTLEKKNDLNSDIKLGSFIRHGMGKQFQRDFRAMGVFLGLVGDTDVKNDNTRVKMIPFVEKDGSNSYKLVFSVSDMGVAFGFGYPNLYPRDFVKKTSRWMGKVSGITLAFRKFFSLPLIKSISLNDARWMMKLIAQIPREKIVETFRVAGHPEVVSKFYAEIFLRRADQLYEALEMVGKTYHGVDGKPFKIETRSTLVNKETFTIPEHKEFFEAGRLSDPDNKLFDPDREPFPRDWGTKIAFSGKGKDSQELARVFTKGLLLQGGNLVQSFLLNNMQFTNVMGLGSGLLCKMNCFYNGGKVGLDWFIPMRFVLENPTKNAHEYPYWVVDMFRLAIGLGDGAADIFQKLGLTSTEATLGLGAEFVKGFDMIKIRPVKDYSTAVGSLKNNDGATMRFLFRNVGKQVLDKMEPGDFLISASYIGTRASALIQPNAITSLISAGLEGGGEVYYSSRTYLYKGLDNQILANWVDTSRYNTFIAGFIRVLISRTYLLKAEYEVGNEINHVYHFDLNKADEYDMLLKNVNKSSPKKIPESFHTHLKEVSYSGSQLGFNLIGLQKVQLSKGKSEVKGYNFLTAEDVHAIAFEKKKKVGALRDLEIIDRKYFMVRSQMNKDKEIFSRMLFKYYDNQAEKSDFLRALEKNQSYIPKDFIVFDPSSVKEHLGKINLQSQVIISNEGIEELFGDSGPTDKQVCEAYREHMGIPETRKGDWCGFMLGSLPSIDLETFRVRKFFHRFQRAKHAYRFKEDFGVENKESKSKAYDFLTNLTKVLSSNQNRRKVLDVFSQWISPSNIYRDVELRSLLDGFPGETDIIHVSPASKGKLVPKSYHFYDTTDELFKIFTDDVENFLKQQGLLDRTSIRALL